MSHAEQPLSENKRLYFPIYIYFFLLIHQLYVCLVLPFSQDMSEGSGCVLVKARFAFQQTNEDELSFSKGDIISVSRQEDGGWWEGSLNGKSGWFPSNYVRELKGSGGCLLLRCCASCTSLTAMRAAGTESRFNIRSSPQQVIKTQTLAPSC